MNLQIHLSQHAHGRLVGSRLTASKLRSQAEAALATQKSDVLLDFSGTCATQSFVDELIGVLILRKGPDVLPHLIFKGCSDDVRAIIEFVVADRYDQFMTSHGAAAQVLEDHAAHSKARHPEAA